MKVISSEVMGILPHVKYSVLLYTWKNIFLYKDYRQKQDDVCIRRNVKQAN